MQSIKRGHLSPTPASEAREAEEGTLRLRCGVGRSESLGAFTLGTERDGYIIWDVPQSRFLKEDPAIHLKINGLQ